MASFRPILHYYAMTHSAFLHAHGENGTQLLVDRLDPQPGERILELGFGTGHTLLRLAETYRKCEFYGLESSTLMLQKTVSRFKACKSTAPARLALYKDFGRFPFDDGMFDRVLCESALAIQPGKFLVTLLEEIRRVLRPGGKLVFNETIWMDSTSLQELEHINQSSLDNFAIVQANGLFPYQADWHALLESLDFHVWSMEKLNDLVRQGTLPHPIPVHRNSRNFSRVGALKARMTVNMQRNYEEFEKFMGRLLRGKEYLEGFLVVAERIED